MIFCLTLKLNFGKQTFYNINIFVYYNKKGNTVHEAPIITRSGEG